MGKTHILKYIAKKINDILGKKEQPAIAIYIDNPGMNSRRLIQSLLEHIGLDEFRKYIGIVVIDEFVSGYKEGGKNFLRNFYASQLSLLNEEDFHKLLTEPERSNFNSFFEEYKKHGFSVKKIEEFIKKTICDKIIGDTFASEQFAALLFGDEYSVYRSWESITTGGLKTRQSSEKSQREFFKGVINILKAQGYSHLYILLDEFEDITISKRISRPKMAEYLSMIRIFVDEHIPEISIIIGCAPTGWEAVKLELPALASRFMEINLTGLDVDQIRNLIVSYLDTARNSRKYAKYKGSIRPFSEEMLPNVLKKSLGNTRSLLITCQRLIEYSAQKKIPEITNRTFDEFVKEKMPYAWVK